MLLVYIASAYTQGDVALNVRASLEAADKVLELGFLPYPPLLSHFWHLVSPKPYEAWMEIDAEWVKRCDILLRLPGESKGADAEVSLAQSLGLPIVFSLADLNNLPRERPAGTTLIDSFNRVGMGMYRYRFADRIKPA